MQYVSTYPSPLGQITLASDGMGLTGLWFAGQKYFAFSLDKDREEKELPVLAQAKRWLDVYFSGQEPDFNLPLHFTGTPFQQEVWEILCAIPYGRTMTYGQIAKYLAGEKGIQRMSAQAVGGAVGRNPIAIVVPCHRVVGSDGSLTGYAGGIDRKIRLLQLEKTDMTALSVPGKDALPEITCLRSGIDWGSFRFGP